MATSKKGEAAFFAKHDDRTKIPKRISEALALMLREGKDRWEYNDDFRKLTGLSVVQLKEYRRNFAKYLVWAPADGGKRDSKLVWCAAAEQALKFSKVPGARKYDPVATEE